MKKYTTDFGCCICSVRHLSNTEIGKRISSTLARRILVKNNLVEPKLSEVLTMMQILKHLQRGSIDLAAEVEYITVIEYHQQITDKPTKVEPSELKLWIDIIGDSIVCLKNLEQED